MSTLQSENQQLRDEINRLKGEHGLPQFKKKKAKTIQPQPGTEEPKSKSKKTSTGKKSDRVKIDRIQIVSIDRDKLPADAVFKGYKRLVQQNVRLVRENVAYDVEVFYSKSEGGSFRAPMPADYRGAFGYDLLSLTQYLHNFGDMTQGRLEAMFHDLGVIISSGTICNLLLKEGEWAIEERDDILRAGLQGSRFSQMDATRTVESGQVRNTQIICADFFKVFYTRPGRTRLDIICALQGMDGEQTKLRYNKIARHFMSKFKVNQKDQRVIAQQLEEGEKLSLDEVWKRLERNEDLASAKKARRSKINDALALGHYYTQEEYSVVDFLLSDDAKEYKTVARRGHALCWLHDIRFYRKMVSKSTYHQELLDTFIDSCWSFYGELKAYRTASYKDQRRLKGILSKQFDELFGVSSDYENLEAKMKRTFANRAKLLTFLDNTDIPLHNNSAERGARRVVRKRDISLHTCSGKGTSVKDGFLSVVETARKLGVNVLDYIDNRQRGELLSLSLAERVTAQYGRLAPAF